MKKTLLFYSLFFILFSIIQKVAGVLTKIIIAQTLTPYEYGIITLVAISLPGLFQLATNLNFYYILSHSEEGKKYFGFTLVYSLFITVILSILLLLFSINFFGYLNLPSERWQLLCLVIIISMLPLSIIIDFQGLLTGLRVYSIPGLIVALPSLFRLISLFFLVYFFNVISFEIIILIFAFSNAIPLFFILFSKRFRGYLVLIKSVNIPSKKMFAFGSSLFIVGSFSVIGQYLIKIVISHDLGIEWQGYYDVSLTIASLLTFAIGTMSFVSIPEATNPDKNAIYEKGGLGDVSRGLFSLLVFLLIILYFYSDFIVTNLFSEDYEIASKYVFILAIGSLFLFIQMFLANLNLSSAKRGRDYLQLTLITLFLIPLFFFLTKFLINFFKEYGYGNGFIGAYLSYTALLILYTILTIYYSQDISPLRILIYKMERLVVSFMITFLVLYYLNLSPLAGIPISGIIFAILIFTSGYLKKSMFLEIFKSSKT